MTCTRINIEGDTPMFIFKAPQLGSIALPDGVIVRCARCGNACHDFGQHCHAIIFPNLIGRKIWKAVSLMVDCDICNVSEPAILDFENEEAKKRFNLPYEIQLPSKSEIFCAKCREPANLTESAFFLTIKNEHLILAMACDGCKEFTMPIIFWLEV